jgi:hypothetical protein
MARAASLRAAEARSEAGALGVGAEIVERDVLPSGRARPARGAAVHAGGSDRVDEGTVCVWIAGDHGLPAGVFGGFDVHGDSIVDVGVDPLDVP